MTAHSTRDKAEQKSRPKKPRVDFPLFPHATGRWCKKIRGKFQYFGKVADDPRGVTALERWLEQKDDLLAGRTPRAAREGFTVADLVNRYLTAKRALVDTGELVERSWADYHRASGRVVAAFGRDRLVDDLAAEDFGRLRAKLAKTLGPVSLGNEIQRVRMLFKWAYDECLIDKPIRYGQSLNRPAKKTLRKVRNASGPRMFQADEIRAMLAKAGQPLRTMILLGINCGLGNSDCATLPKKALDLKAGWLNYPRPKTGVQRRCCLWPETIQALREALAGRPTSKHKADAGLVFVTSRGLAWGKKTSDNPISKETRKLLDTLAIDGRRNFYALRHTFQTIGDEVRDPIATRFVMGHAESPNDMSAVYREAISDARLRAVVEYVRRWVFDSAKDT